MSRELDAKVAELVMGWDFVSEGYGRAPIFQHVPDLRYPVPPYTTNASDDYEVLKHVRETWSDPDMVLGFQDSLNELWDARWKGGPNLTIAYYYEPGDYSIAALAVKEAT